MVQATTIKSKAEMKNKYLLNVYKNSDLYLFHFISASIPPFTKLFKTILLLKTFLS